MADFEELESFLTQANLDAIGVFGYSDEDGTEAAGFEGKLDEDEILERVSRLADLAEELTAQRLRTASASVSTCWSSRSPQTASPRAVRPSRGRKWTAR